MRIKKELIMKIVTITNTKKAMMNMRAIDH
jgi:hypothetical protein